MWMYPNNKIPSFEEFSLILKLAAKGNVEAAQQILKWTTSKQTERIIINKDEK